jgi:nucleotide-binding universal stress UspA family protein
LDLVKILVPAGEHTDSALIALAADLLGARPGVIVLLAVIELPLGHQPVAGASAAHAARRALRRLSADSTLSGVAIQARVRAARHRAAGIREVADEERPDLLLLSTEPDGAINAAERELLATPPCDTVIARLRHTGSVHSLLVPARGGPTAELALSVGLNVAARRGAQMTLLHLDLPGATLHQREHELRLFGALLNRSAYPRLRSSTMHVPAPEPALIAEAGRHDMVVMGATLHADASAGEVLGAIPDAMLARAPGTVLVVKLRTPPDVSVFVPQPPVDVVVDKWFVENTFHCREFADLDELVGAKRAQGLRMSVILLPAGDAEALPAILRVVEDELHQRAGLVDEVLAMDDGTPDFAGVAAAAGARVQPVSPAERGMIVWAGLQEAIGDIIVWLDSDIRNAHPRFVYGLVGPLLREPRVALVTGFHRLPGGSDQGFEDGQEQTTELAIRPLVNLYFPELSGMINPLSRERAVRRGALDGMRLPSGLGVDIALLLEVYERAGLWAIAQTDLEERVGRRERAGEVSRRAFATVQTLVGRLTPDASRAARAPHASMKLIHHEAERYHIEVIDTSETLLPAIPARRAAATAGP